MSTYTATQVGRYLQERFGFTFLEQEPYRRLEDHIWEAGRRAQTQRKDIERTCHALAEDIRYVLTSAEKLDRAPYVPNQRGDFAAAVALCVELEREVQDLIGVHEATVAAVRALLANTPTLEEHSLAQDDSQRWERERGELKEDNDTLRNKVDELEEELRKANDPGELGR